MPGSIHLPQRPFLTLGGAQAAASLAGD